VVSRKQLLELGLDDNFIRHATRHRELHAIHEGVYVTHTGEPTWLQHAWAAVLSHWPAALSHDSVLHIHDMHRGCGRRDTEDIHITIDHGRTVSKQSGVQVHRKREWDRFVQPSRVPAQIRLEHAVLDVASEAKSEADAIATLADACQSRRTTAARLARALRSRPKLKRRRFLLAVLEDVASGVYSLLEHRYLTRVERPHGLPTAKRQRHVRPGRTSAYRDVEYRGLRTIVELDGRLGHEWQVDRWNDFDRDVVSAVEGITTLRLGWRQVLDPCRVARAVGAVLRAHGWTGELRPCSTTCPVRRVRVESQSDSD
jgi:hypothetical protein